jgi:hypothetical protein
MKRTMLFTAAAVLAFAGARPSFGGDDAAQDLKLMRTHADQADRQAARVRELATPAARLAAFERAVGLYQLAWADGKRWRTDDFASVRRQINAGLVRAYDGESEIYYVRRSLPLAMDRAYDALDIDPQDPRAANLVVMIDDAARTDIYSKYQGVAAIERIRDRRAAEGIPLRDRGVALRR